MEALTWAVQEACRTLVGLFNTLNSKFELNNETILSLQYCKLVRWDNENAEELIVIFHIMAMKCKYEEVDRHLKESLFLV